MHHLTLATEGRARLFAEDGNLLQATRAVARIGREHQLLFAIADDHIHSVVTGSPTIARYVAASLSRVLARLPGGRPLSGARIRAVNGRNHLETLVPYVLTQPSHHGLAGHPAAWVGSCFPDLVGARQLGGFDRAKLEAALPRYPLLEAACTLSDWSPSSRRLPRKCAISGRVGSGAMDLQAIVSRWAAFHSQATTSPEDLDETIEDR